MTTIELRASIATDLEQMSLEMLENVSRYVKQLRLHPRTVHVEEEYLTPYTVEELLERAEKGRREIAQGNYVTSEEVFRDLFEEFGLDPDDMKEIEKQVEEAEPLNAQTVWESFAIPMHKTDYVRQLFMSKPNMVVVAAQNSSRKSIGQKDLSQNSHILVLPSLFSPTLPCCTEASL